ncbi:MAG: hypothetical protein P8Z81_00590 [Deinococcales bacterium]|jgi:hypothetical protein
MTNPANSLPDTGTPGTGAPACLPNISLRERRRRLTFGVVMLILGVVALIALVLTGVGRWWRLPLALLFYPAAVGYFQWRDHTCVALAARDQRKLGDRAERIEDTEELGQIKAQARAVQRKALAAGIVLLAVALAV